MANWKRNTNGSYEIQFDGDQAVVAQFLNGSTSGYVNPQLAAEFDAQFKKDNKYTGASRAKDGLIAFGKFCRVMLLVLAFLVGQATVYYFYFVQESVFLIDLLFDEIELLHLIIPSAIGLISIVLVIVGTQILFREGQSGDAWAYIIFSVLFFVGLPMLAGVIFLVPSIAIIPLVKSYKGEGVPIVIAITAFIVGQVALWATYLLTGYIVGLTELLEALDAADFDIFFVLIISSVISLAATIVGSALGYGYVNDDKKGSAYGILIVFCLLAVGAPALSSILSFLIMFIVACCVDDSDQFQATTASFIIFSMASMLFMYVSEVPLWVLLIMGTVELSIFCGVFNDRRSYSVRGRKYNPFSIVVFSLVGVAFLGYAIYRMDSILPNLATLIDMADKNKVSSDYLTAVMHEARIAMIVGSAAATLIMIIQVCSAKRRIPSVTLPLMTVSGMSAFYLILNELIKIPESASDEYSSMFILWLILGSILIVLPTVIFQIISYSISRKASRYSYY